jgi:hypothetical protein
MVEALPYWWEAAPPPRLAQRAALDRRLELLR